VATLVISLGTVPSVLAAATGATYQRVVLAMLRTKSTRT
jgi:hypothetical protein